MSKMIQTLALAAVAMTLAGCSVRNCGTDAAYLDNPPAPPLEVPTGVSLAEPSPLYTIPAGGEGEFTLRRDSADPEAKGRGSCLFDPPPLQADAA